jgi:hypothetical protein
MMDDDEFDDTLRIEGVLTGEEWLTSNFMLASNEALNQTEVIKKRYQEEQKERLNKSDISRSNRPVSPFGSCGDNPFGVSKMGYANPSSDRSMLSAMKTRDKIPRTPVEKGNRKDWKDNYISDHPYDMGDYMRKPHGKEGPYDPQPAPFNYGGFEPYEPKGKTLNEQIFYMDQAQFIE